MQDGIGPISIRPSAVSAIATCGHPGPHRRKMQRRSTPYPSIGGTHAKLDLDAVLLVQAAFRHAIHALERIALAGVDSQHEFGGRGSASVKAPRGIEVRGALVCAEGVRLASDPTQQVSLAVRPSGLIWPSFFEQLVELERFAHPSMRECSIELGTKIHGGAFAPMARFVGDQLLPHWTAQSGEY